MARRHPASKRQSGFSMIEVLVSLVILLLGLLGLAGLILVSQRGETESYQRSQALMLLQDMVSRINANRTVAACYITNSTTTASYVGTNGTLPPPCAFGTLPANALANADIQAWSNLLTGSSETLGGNNAGAMVGARGCVTFDPVANVYMVSVAWQGIAPTTAPIASLTCGQNQYGDEALRRVVSAPVQIANLN